MTIKGATYQLCKSIIRSQSRATVLNVFDSLNTGDRGTFGYRARTMRAQFAGFLALHRDRQEFSALGPLPDLDEAELHTLTMAHGWIAMLDADCLEPYSNALFPLQPLLNPYAHLALPLIPPAPEASPVPRDSTRALIEQFRAHPALAIITNTLARIQDQLQPGPLSSAVDGIEALLLASGPLSCPPQIEYVAFTAPPDSNQRLVYRLIAAILAVRTSLSVVNELLYQAFLTDKLPVISADTIVALRPLTSNLAGWGISLITTPEPLFVPSDPQLFLLKIRDDAMPPIDLCRTERQSFSIASELGDTVELWARALDDNLNPYAPLLRHL